jgi:hypothetical protein
MVFINTNIKPTLIPKRTTKVRQASRLTQPPEDALVDDLSIQAIQPKPSQTKLDVSKKSQTYTKNKDSQQHHTTTLDLYV